MSRKESQAAGILVPPHSLKPPVVVQVREKELQCIPAGAPEVVPANRNVSTLRLPEVAHAVVPVTIVPGTGPYVKPSARTVSDSTALAGTPEMAPALAMDSKDPNPESFSFFNKLQGLKHNEVNCMIEDSFGNIWLGTNGGGATKYDGKNFTYYTQNEGLSDNIIWAMLQDHQGNIWFGTSMGGLVRFDGITFTYFSSKQGMENETVLALLEDRRGNIWAGTNGGGAYKISPSQKADKVSYKLTRFSTKEGLCNNEVLCMKEDKEGNIWFGTNGGGISKYDGKCFYQFNEKQGLSNNLVYSILEDRKGNFWFGTYGSGLSKFDGHRFYHLSDKQGLRDNTVLTLHEDISGNIWLGTFGGGAAKLTPSNSGESQTYQCTYFTGKEGLGNEFVSCIISDRSGNIWMGTNGGGVLKYNGKTFTHLSEIQGVSNQVVSPIVKDTDNNLWIGTSGDGVYKYDGQQFYHYSQKQGLRNGNILSILQDKAGNFWFGTFGEGVCKFDGKRFTYFNKSCGLSNNDVRCMLEDKQGRIWFGTLGGGVSIYDGKTMTQLQVSSGLSNNFVTSMLQDRKGNVWVGTAGGGLNCFTGKEWLHYNRNSGLPHEDIRSLYEDKTGNLWMGTAGGGIIRYDGSRFLQFTEKSGLSNNYVLSMLQDRSGNLWLGTRFGLSKLAEPKLLVLDEKNEAENVLFKNYTYEDGFLGIGCNAGSICEDKDGKIWIGTNDRLTVYHPPSRQELALDTIAPDIQVTGISLFNESIPWQQLAQGKVTELVLGNGSVLHGFSYSTLHPWFGIPQHLSLAYNNNFLTFSYVGITQKQSNKVKYKYRLLGLDDNWSGLTGKTEATFNNLAPGEYTFLVKAINTDGYKSKEYRYAFVVRPPWWLTWWAYVSYFVLGGLAFITYTNFRERSLMQRQKVLERKVDEATLVIRHQKEEVEQQKEVAEKRKQEVEAKNKEILDSITYAKRIQSAILPTPRLVRQYHRDSFILYMPKDIVAGDFYWMEPVNGKVYLAVCDCTGHGVPGAMVSVVCNTALNRSLNEFGLRDPGEIFNKTRELVIENFARSDHEVNDGMDASLCVFDPVHRSIQWAGANNGLWIFRSDEKQLEEIKPDKQPIGRSHMPKPFTTHQVQLAEGDTFYLFTDGFADQFGGPAGKKLTRAKFREFLLGIVHLDLEDQRQALLKFHLEYRGKLEQVDDICVVGVRV
jgi:ligand-binding sensor domain-containing protein